MKIQSDFLKNILNEKYITDIKISERLDGSFQATVEVDPVKKGVVVGREGRNAEKARILARRYFNITYVMINSKEESFRVVIMAKSPLGLFAGRDLRNKKKKTALGYLNLQKKRIRFRQKIKSICRCSSSKRNCFGKSRC